MLSSTFHEEELGSCDVGFFAHATLCAHVSSFPCIFTEYCVPLLSCQCPSQSPPSPSFSFLAMPILDVTSSLLEVVYSVECRVAFAYNAKSSHTRAALAHQQSKILFSHSAFIVV